VPQAWSTVQGTPNPTVPGRHRFHRAAILIVARVAELAPADFCHQLQHSRSRSRRVPLHPTLPKRNPSARSPPNPSTILFDLPLADRFVQLLKSSGSHARGCSLALRPWCSRRAFHLAPAAIDCNGGSVSTFHRLKRLALRACRHSWVPRIRSAPQSAAGRGRCLCLSIMRRQAIHSTGKSQ
jgi:hypothetical protein